MAMAGNGKDWLVYLVPQTRDFSEVFFGSLAIALVYFLIRHFTTGIAKPGTKRFDLTMLALAFWCFISVHRWLGSYSWRSR